MLNQMVSSILLQPHSKFDCHNLLIATSELSTMNNTSFELVHQLRRMSVRTQSTRRYRKAETLSSSSSGCEPDLCAGFDAMSSTVTSPLTPSSSYISSYHSASSQISSQASQSSSTGSSSPVNWGRTLSRSPCIRHNLSALGSRDAASESSCSYPRYQHKISPNEGWGYFADTPQA